MSEATTSGYDLYMRHTTVEGKTSVVQHRVWDKEAFVAARQSEAEKENAKQPSGAPRKAAVQQITHEQYIKERR